MKPVNDPRDTILDELHATRQQLLLQHGGVAGLAAFLRQQEADCATSVVEPDPDPRTDKTDHPGRNRRAVRG